MSLNFMKREVVDSFSSPPHHLHHSPNFSSLYLNHSNLRLFSELTTTTTIYSNQYVGLGDND